MIFLLVLLQHGAELLQLKLQDVPMSVKVKKHWVSPAATSCCQLVLRYSLDVRREQMSGKNWKPVLDLYMHLKVHTWKTASTEKKGEWGGKQYCYWLLRGWHFTPDTYGDFGKFLTQCSRASHLHCVSSLLLVRDLRLAVGSPSSEQARPFTQRWPARSCVLEPAGLSQFYGSTQQSEDLDFRR